MKLPVKVTFLSLFLDPLGHSQIHAQDFDKEAAVQDVKAITKAFAGSLQS